MLEVDTDLQELNSYDGNSDYSDPEDYVDDISDTELLGDILAEEPKKPGNVEERVIVVDGIPKVEESRFNKLKTVLQNIFNKIGPIKSFHMPKDELNKTKGFAFIEYEKSEHAVTAIEAKSGYKLDKSHTFKVNSFLDFNKFKNVSDSWSAPERKQLKSVGNLYWYLEDENCNDQFSVIYADKTMTAIYLNTVTEPVLLEQRDRWTEMYVRWSPKGAYLATLHTKGIALWAGEKFKQVQRFIHQGVCFVDFSPCERYLVTFGGETSHCIIIWDIFSGLMKRTFQIDMTLKENSVWPLFKWSHDGQYFARQTKNAIRIYETPSMKLLQNKGIEVSNVEQFVWSPSDNLLAYWVMEKDQIPARVTIVHIPSRREIRVKNVFNVILIRLHWHNQGNFLCVKVDRYHKTKKIHYSTFEIFHINEKQVPVDIIELQEHVQAFAWEPNGNKFCCLQTVVSGYTTPCFYEIKNGKVEQIATLERSTSSHIFWSPAGQFLVLASLEPNSGKLMFVDTSDMRILHTNEHSGASAIEWCPTGRFVITTANWWMPRADHGSFIWSFQGRLLRKIEKEQQSQVLWRPRPPTLLSANQIKKIKKNNKHYSKMFEAKDRLLQSKVSKKILDQRKSLMDNYREFRKRCAIRYQENTPYRRELRNGVNTDEIESKVEDDWTEMIVEVMISETVEVVEANKE